MTAHTSWAEALDASPRAATGRRTRRRLTAAAVAAAALGALALSNAALARRAASGPPVVLLHGNLVTLDDWIASGLVDCLAAAGRRVVAFDRPGFGRSERPEGRWGAGEQAALLRRAAGELGVERPPVVGHSWGALAALAWAQDAVVAGAALVSGYYHPTARLDALVVAPAAAPGIGPVVRHTLAPPFAA